MGPGGLGWMTRLLPAPSSFSAWHGEGASVCGIPECVPVGMMTIPKAPSWAGLSLPVAYDLQLWLGHSHCGPEVDQRAKRSLGQPSSRLGRRQVSKALPSPGRPGGTTPAASEHGQPRSTFQPPD